MKRLSRWFAGLILPFFLLFLTFSLGAQSRPTPRPEPIAETRLVMEGVTQANYRGMEKLLKQKPADAEAWAFIRGQALLVAESGNLLMLRPPHTGGQQAWLEQASDLRTVATRIARLAAERDYERSRAGLGDLATVCNRCHHTFRVPYRLVPFAEAPAKD